LIDLDSKDFYLNLVFQTCYYLYPTPILSLTYRNCYYTTLPDSDLPYSNYLCCNCLGYYTSCCWQ
jgi:hypothetical protein